MSKFKVGDRVRAIHLVDNLPLTGKSGTVVAILPLPADYQLAVEFDDNISGLTCLGLTLNGHGRYGYDHEFELVEPQPQPLDFNTYQQQARKTAIYPTLRLQVEPNATYYASWVYPLIGLSGEVGELQNKLKKVIRDTTAPDIADIQAELGDILWYLSQVATEFDLSLDDIAHENLIKLKARQLGNKICGEGDNR